MLKKGPKINKTCYTSNTGTTSSLTVKVTVFWRKCADSHSMHSLHLHPSTPNTLPVRSSKTLVQVVPPLVRCGRAWLTASPSVKIVLLDNMHRRVTPVTPAHSAQADEGALLTVAVHVNRFDLGRSGTGENPMKIHWAKAGVHKCVASCCRD